MLVGCGVPEVPSLADASLADPDLYRKLEHYEASLAMLQRVAPAMPLVQQLAFELWALRNLPPATSRRPAPHASRPVV